MRPARWLCAAALILCAALARNAGSAPNPGFDAVEAKLDRGGSLFLYMNIENALNRAIDKIEPALRESNAPPAAMVAPIARAAIASLGLAELGDFGLSKIETADGKIRYKAYLRLAQRKGLFELLGGEPRPLEALAMIPADAAFFVAQELDLSKALDLAQQTAAAISGPAGQGAIDSALMQAKTAIGTDVKTLIDSFAGEIAFYLRVSDTETIEVPVGWQEAALMPKPSFTLMMKTKDGSLYGVVEKLVLQSGTPIVKSPDASEPGMLALDAPSEPRSNPLALKPVIAQRKGWFMIASDPAELQRSLNAAENSVRSAGEFQALSAGLPELANGVFYMGAPLSQGILRFMANRKLLLDEYDQGPKAAMSAFANFLASHPRRLGVRVNDPEGVLFVMQSDHAPIPVPPPDEAMVALATDRKNRQIVMDEIMKIDNAKMQWALENNKQEGDEPTWEDLVGPGKYMQEMPQDPVGGSYKINPYGTPPEHSVYGKPDW